MRTIGVVGGIGSGKSYVSKILAKKLHGVVINADAVGHRSLEQPEVQMQLQARDLPCSREQLGAIVFNDPEALEFLETITYPFIDKEIRRLISCVNNRYFDCVILDAPLLIEGGWHPLCDKIVFIDCPFEQRVKNVAAREQRVKTVQGNSHAESYLKNRERNQFSLEVKQSFAQITIKNFSSESIEDQIKRNFRILKV